MSCENDSCSKESLAFRKLDNEKYIPSVVDGLTPGQRKVVFMSFKLCKEEEVCVQTVTSAVASSAAFNESESVRSQTIVKLAQDFVGSNNINILLPMGQFGARLDGGRSAAPAYQIYTQLNPMMETILSALDEPLLTYLFDDNMKIEPEYYMPVIPMVLVNGVNVKTNSFLSKIPKYNPKDLVENIYCLLENKELKSMMPWYKGFRGTVDQITNHSYVMKGLIKVLPGCKLEILELPVGESTYHYVEDVLKKLDCAGDILNYQELNYSCDTVHFKIKVSPEKFKLMEAQGFHEVFGLQKLLDTSSMMLLDENNDLKHYRTPEDIIRDFYDIRIRMYKRRKEYHTALLSAEIKKLDNQFRFVSEIKEGLININNKRSRFVIEMLRERNYDSDPVQIINLNANKTHDVWESDEEDNVESKLSLPDFGYLLDIPISYTFKQDKFLREKNKKIQELKAIKIKQPEELWKDDLKIFMDQFEESLVKESKS